MTHEPSGLVTRAQIIERIGERLAGRLGDAALAKWAFDSFYAMERDGDATDGERTPDRDALLGEALDALMFGDDPDFQLSEAELRALADRLAQG